MKKLFEMDMGRFHFVVTEFWVTIDEQQTMGLEKIAIPRSIFDAFLLEYQQNKCVPKKDEKTLAGKTLFDMFVELNSKINPCEPYIANIPWNDLSSLERLTWNMLAEKVELKK